MGAQETIDAVEEEGDRADGPGESIDRECDESDHDLRGGRGEPLLHHMCVEDQAGGYPGEQQSEGDHAVEDSDRLRNRHILTGPEGDEGGVAALSSLIKGQQIPGDISRDQKERDP